MEDEGDDDEWYGKDQEEEDEEEEGDLEDVGGDSWWDFLCPTSLGRMLENMLLALELLPLELCEFEK